MNRTAAPDPVALDERTKVSHRQALVIVGAMTASLFVYAIVVEMLSRGGSIVDRGVPEIVRWAFYGVAVTMVFTSHVVKSVMLRGLDVVAPDQALARLTTAHIVTAAMAEVPAILGFVLFFLGPRFYKDFYIFSLISLYMLFRHFPRYGLWESAMRRHMASS